MKYQIQFFFGAGEDKDGNTITVTQQLSALADIKREAIRLFGGYTLLKTEGGWHDNFGRLVEEPGYVVVTFRDVLLGHLNDEFARIIKTALDQQSVLVVATKIEGVFV